MAELEEAEMTRVHAKDYLGAEEVHEAFAISLHLP